MLSNFLGFWVIFIAPTAGIVIAEAVRLVIHRRRNRTLNKLVVAAVFMWRIDTKHPHRCSPYIWIVYRFGFAFTGWHLDIYSYVASCLCNPSRQRLLLSLGRYSSAIKLHTMLRELRIENFAIIPHLDINFNQGLIIFTGETGAGKSIILDALELVVGGKSDPTNVRSGSDHANLQAVFRIPAFKS